MPHKKQIRLVRAADIPPLPTPHREPGRAARFLMREFPHALPLNRRAWGLIGAAEYTVSLYIYGLCMGVDIGLYEGIAAHFGHEVRFEEGLAIGYILLLLYLIALAASVWRRSFGFTKYYMLLLGTADIAVACAALALCILTQSIPMIHSESAQTFASCVCCTLLMGTAHIMRYLCARRYGYFSFIASCILWSRRETPTPARRSLWHKLTHPGALGLITLLATIPAHPRVHFTPRIATYCAVVNLSQESISLLGIDELAAADPRFASLWTEPQQEAELAGVCAPRSKIFEYRADAIPFASPELTLHWARTAQPRQQQTSLVPLQGAAGKNKRAIILIYRDGGWHGILRDNINTLSSIRDFAQLLPER